MGFRKISIAGINILYEFPQDYSVELLEDFVHDFEGMPDITVKAAVCGNIRRLDVNPFFDTNLDWYCTASGYVIDKSDKTDKQVQVRMTVNKSWTCAEILAVKGYGHTARNIEGIFLEILFRSRLINYSGLVVHGSAVLVDGKAILFSAPSGTGKSTQAGLWARYKGAVHINDDHPAVVLKDGIAAVYGTPWAGSDSKYTNTSAPLRAIVILEQSAANTIKSLTGPQLVKNLLPRCFLPYYDMAWMDKAMDVFNGITGSVPVFKLECRPDREAVELLAETLEKELKE